MPIESTSRGIDPLDILPVEAWTHIFSFFGLDTAPLGSRDDLHSLTLSCSIFRDIAQPILYRNIKVKNAWEAPHHNPFDGMPENKNAEEHPSADQFFARAQHLAALATGVVSKHLRGQVKSIAWHAVYEPCTIYREDDDTDDSGYCTLHDDLCPSVLRDANALMLTSIPLINSLTELSLKNISTPVSFFIGLKKTLPSLEALELSGSNPELSTAEGLKLVQLSLKRLAWSLGFNIPPGFFDPATIEYLDIEQYGTSGGLIDCGPYPRLNRLVLALNSKAADPELGEVIAFLKKAGGLFPNLLDLDIHTPLPLHLPEGPNAVPFVRSSPLVPSLRSYSGSLLLAPLFVCGAPIERMTLNCRQPLRTKPIAAWALLQRLIGGDIRFPALTHLAIHQATPAMVKTVFRNVCSTMPALKDLEFWMDPMRWLGYGLPTFDGNRAALAFKVSLLPQYIASETSSLTVVHAHTGADFHLRQRRRRSSPDA